MTFKSNLPQLGALDKRLNAYRSDLANIEFKGKVEATCFVEGKLGVICNPVVNLKGSPDLNSNTEHQLLLGEEVQIFEQTNNHVWVQSNRDGYTGYVATNAIATGAPTPTHVVCVPFTFHYPQAELRQPPLATLSMGSRVTVSGEESVRGTKYLLLEEGGAIIEKHLRAVGEFDDDFILVCEQLLNTPYLWGGSSGLGIDCSGLVQLSMRQCGREILRDSDMQAATLGEEIDPSENYCNLQRGDLIFWRGHMAIHKGTVHHVPHIIHASGHTMSVAAEPLVPALERIEYLYEKPIGFRRP